MGLFSKLFGKPQYIPSKIDYLIAGLGNPGKKYEKSRHNAGWMVADALAQKHNAEFISSGIYWQCVLKIGGKNALLIMPTTFMNLSGEAVRKASQKHNISPLDVIVIVDEYNFPVGKVHAKTGGSDGGHNGLKSIIQELGTQEFIRLRCGIGKNFPPGGMVDYVLSDFEESEQENLKLMIGRAVEAVEGIVSVGKERAMPIINSGNLFRDEQ